MQPGSVPHNPQYLVDNEDNEFEMNIDYGDVQQVSSIKVGDKKDGEAPFRIFDSQGNEKNYYPEEINSKDSGEEDALD